LVKQIHLHSLAECIRLEESENQKTSKHVVSTEGLDLISKISKSVATIERNVVSKNKSVWKKKLEPVLIIHMRIREVTYE
jgi:hypothetical protein